jgi:hypothetical protein
MSGQAWRRRGFNLLWEASALSQAAKPEEVVSLRQFFALSRSWPGELPSGDGIALVVAGLDGCLDAMNETDAETWLGNSFKKAVLGFEDHYESQAALVFWLPSGRKRIFMSPAKAQYFWKPSSRGENAIPLSALFGGSQDDLHRILAAGTPAGDLDGDGWIGLHHPRIT